MRLQRALVLCFVVHMLFPPPVQRTALGQGANVDMHPVRIDCDPLKIMAGLMSSSADERRLSLLCLGFDVATKNVGSAPPARLFFAQLDADSDLEAVIAFQEAGVSIVSVLDKRQGHWWRVGKITNGWRNLGNIDRDIEFRDIINVGEFELLIRDNRGGTDIAETRISIYRLQGGQLHLVFETTEDARYRTIGGKSGTTYEHAWFYYPDRDVTTVPIIVVDRVKAELTAPALIPELQLRGLPSQCEAFRWNDGAGEFVSDLPTTRTFCRTRMPALR